MTKEYVECQSCGTEFYTNNEDQIVTEFCDMCGEYGSDYQVDRGDYPEPDYCNHEDYPCCGCS